MEKDLLSFYRDWQEGKTLLDKETAHGAVDTVHFWDFGLQLNGVMVGMLTAANDLEKELAAMEGLLICIKQEIDSLDINFVKMCSVFVDERLDEEQEPAAVGKAFTTDKMIVKKFRLLSDAVCGVCSIRAQEWKHEKDTCQARAIICLILDGYDAIAREIESNFTWDP